MKKFIFILFIGLMTASSAEASSFILSPKVIGVQAGQTFTLPVIIDPVSEPQYTVRFAITFLPEFLEVTSFDFGPNWIAVSQPKYDNLDNKQGELTKTAGFPRGFSSPISFGTITFLAKKSGDSAITVGSQSFVLNAGNQSTLDLRSQVQIIAAENLVPDTSSIRPLPDLPLGETNIFDISITGAGLSSKVAPGEFLPLSVKLLNFGNKNKVDVTITYQITDPQDKVIYSTEETVAVETTASFVKTIQIPFETIPGKYIAKSSIVYQDQIAPATTLFPFLVERKIFGLFQSDFYLYGGITLLIALFVGLLGYALIKRRHTGRFTPFDYSNIPHGERTFYEILSDTIMQMRGRVGDKALLIASETPGLKIDKETGRVLSLTEPPAKIIATLVSEYEKTLGKKVSFSFRKS